MIESWSIKKQCLFLTLVCFNQCTFSHQAFPKTLKDDFCVTEILFYKSWETKQREARLQREFLSKLLFWWSAFPLFFLSSSDLSVNERRNQWMNQKGVFAQVLLFHCSLSFFILFMDGFLVLKFQDKWLWTLKWLFVMFPYLFCRESKRKPRRNILFFFLVLEGKPFFKKRNYCRKTFSPSSSWKLSSRSGSIWLNYVNIFPTLAWL